MMSLPSDASWKPEASVLAGRCKHMAKYTPFAKRKCFFFLFYIAPLEFVCVAAAAAAAAVSHKTQAD